MLVTRAARGVHRHGCARAEAEALARVAAGLVGEEDPLPSMLARLRTTFDLETAAVLVRNDAGNWVEETSVGQTRPTTLDEATPSSSSVTTRDSRSRPGPRR